MDASKDGSGHGPSPRGTVVSAMPEGHVPTCHPPLQGAQEAYEMETGDFRDVQLSTTPITVKKTLWQKIAIQIGLWGLMNKRAPGEPAKTNQITTAKYTIISFLPINLYQQFMRLANLYFLVVAILQLVPGLAPTSWFTTVFPLVVVLAVNAIKEAYDDFHRHKNDNQVNARTCHVLALGGQEHPTPWNGLLVGDVVRIEQDQELPADMILLSSSDDANLCHIETANLDGETNLKSKMCLTQTAGITTADQLLDFQHRHLVRCELPNAKLYKFDGAVIDKLDSTQPHVPLTIDNLLLRGSTLRKTSWVIGLVVYIGEDTKVMMNHVPSARKVTQMERHMNVLVGYMLVWVLFSSIMLGAGEQIFNGLHTGYWYLRFTGTWPDLGQGFPGWIIQTIRFIILINGFIPISLYITLEMIKVLQCMLMLNQDRKMYHKESDTPFACRTTSLNEDLGQVAYVLSDKTGTLTQNVMGFVWASINGVLYGKPGDGRLSMTYQPNLPSYVDASTSHSLALDPRVHTAVQPLGPMGAASKDGKGCLADPAASRFFTLLAVCNTVVPQVLEGGKFVYQAASPDEEALVEGAAQLGFRLKGRTVTSVELDCHGQTLQYEVLAILEFDSDRKRMSIVCRCPDGRVRLMCKGADGVVIERIRGEQKLLPRVQAHLEEMSQAGLRTLCVAEKEISEDDFAAWIKEWHAATVAMEDRDQKIAAVSDAIERDMELLGATAVEDKLQDGVPEAVDALVSSGIKVWVMTGDKIGTAISIAYSCRLFSQGMPLVILTEQDFENAVNVAAGGRAQDSLESRQARRATTSLTREDIILIERKVLNEKRQEVRGHAYAIGQNGIGNVGGAAFTSDFSSPDHEVTQGAAVGLVIDGGALSVALHAEHIDELVSLCTSCKSVVCCRVSPQQKASVTKLVQIKCKAITLGIGDGANDVGMIQAAHIGCGISGREGRAAVLVSDYSFAQFKYVARLVLLHGRIMYKRNTEVVWYSFYKNWMHSLTFIFFAFVSAFSSQPLNTSGLLATYNLFWTSLPIIAYAVTEQDVTQDTASRFPILYQETMAVGRRHFLFTQAKWLLIGCWHALVCYFVPMYSMVTPDLNGMPDGFTEIGTTIYFASVIVVNLKLCMRTRHWTWINHTIVYLSIFLLLPFIWLYGLVWQTSGIAGTANMSRIGNRLYASVRFWLAGVILAPALSLLPDIMIMAYQRTFHPSTAQLLQEAEHVGAMKTGKRGIARGTSAASTAAEAGNGSAEGGLIELRSMVPDKEQMSDVHGQPPPRGKPKASFKKFKGGPSSELWV